MSMDSCRRFGFSFALLSLASAALAAPAIEAPATAVAGATIPVTVTGSGNPRDFVSVVVKGAPVGRYNAYQYIAKPGTVSLELPNEPGDYEVRILGANSPYPTLLSRPIKLTAPTASVKAPPQVAAGSKVTIEWTGPANPRDYVGIGEAAPNGRKYLGYEYTRNGNPITLTAPEQAGNYEVRYFLGAGDKIIARQALTVTSVSATVTVPAQVNAGAKFPVTWTGPNNPRDFITIVPASTPEKTYKGYEYTRAGSPVTLTAPDAPGDYEIRYLTGQGYLTLARAKITVGGVTATLSLPAQIPAGETVSIKWTGPGNPRDFVTIVKAGAVERTWQRYEYTRAGNPLKLPAPDVAGEYEVRYCTGAEYVTLARAKLTVGAVTGTISAPPTIVAGETLRVGWRGADNPLNFITIVAKGAREGTWGPYAYTRKENPVRIIAPLDPGDYEVRYSTGQTYQTLARSALKVEPAKSEPGYVKVTTTKAAFAGGAVEIILDASGSMLQKLGTQRRIDIAKQTLAKLTSATIPAGTPFALRVFGREVDSCQTDLDVAVSPLNPAAVGARINALVAKNGAKTPIGASLEKAADDLKGVTGEKLIVLVTDGEETCGGDPAAAIASLRKAGVTTRVSIVGFALEDQALAATFRRWADAGGGAFFDAKDAAGLDKSLAEAMRAGFEVVNAQGQVLASGVIGGDAVKVPSGNFTVRMQGSANSSKPVTITPQQTASVTL
jgi:hypothetical protein